MTLTTEAQHRERLWLEWAKSPWQCWLKSETKWLELFLEVALVLPLQTSLRLLQPICPLILLPPVHMGRAVRIDASLLAGARLLQVDEALLKRPREEAKAILAHELGHLVLTATGDPLRDDLLADELVMEWGWGNGLLSALLSDLGGDHPRTIAAKNFSLGIRKPLD